jgi:hypothetical protein
MLPKHVHTITFTLATAILLSVRVERLADDVMIMQCTGLLLLFSPLVC